MIFVLQVWILGAVLTSLVCLEMLFGAILGSMQESRDPVQRREDRLFAWFLFCGILMWFISVPYLFYRRYRKSKDDK